MGTQESDALLRDLSKFEQRDHLKPIQRQLYPEVSRHELEAKQEHAIYAVVREMALSGSRQRYWRDL